MNTMFEEFFNQKVKEEVDKALKENSKPDPLKEDFISLVRLVKNYKENAQELYNDFHDQALTVNTIEAEGSYRALLTLYNEIMAYYIPEGLKDDIKNL